MKKCLPWFLTLVAFLIVTEYPALGWTLIGWNDLGMHCMDADYSVFSLLPPYNTIHAQLIDDSGRLVETAGSITVTYEAVEDADGSINTTSVGKTNFWEHVGDLFPLTPAADLGLDGFAMPGAGNTPQPMVFDAAQHGWTAQGIPITPYDDARKRNTYPLMRLVARDGGSRVLARTDIVLPVSDEMDCASCHASTSLPYARPPSGWVNDPDPQRDMRLNILRLHDEREGFRPAYRRALESAGYSSKGLVATVQEQHTSILCARCHASNALPGSGMAEIPSLSQAVHGRMAFTFDPYEQRALADEDNHSACYRCHPGSVTRCLRGVMGSASGATGEASVRCQNCHGGMLDVADTSRQPWLSEPLCQSCHTGNATHGSEALRYTTAFRAPMTPREALDATFASNPDTPLPGTSLFRASKGHGGLACEACHGSTHAELPSSGRNDNVQSVQIQGHPGPLAECTACHPSAPNTVDGGPHGMHPIGQVWVDRHPDVAESRGTSGCRACHGNDLRGTVLSRSRADRVLRTDYGSKTFWRGFQVGCYTCHAGPNTERPSANRAAVASDAQISVFAGATTTLTLTASDADANALALRVVRPPQHGRVGLEGTRATYIADADYEGEDEWRFAAWDGSTDSNLATVAVHIARAPGCNGDCDVSLDVGIEELVRLTTMSSLALPSAPCARGDVDGDGRIQLEELSAAVSAALGSCE